jgi:hypothetical protein
MNDELNPPAAEVGQLYAGRYAIQRVLGHGAMASVFLARDIVVDRRVALKILRARGDDRQAALLLREGRILRSLPPHPAIIRYFDLGVTDGNIFLTQEFVEGMTLDRWQAREPGAGAIVEMYAKIADGLAALHAAGVVHRDLKPSNVLVEERTGQPKLTDMGLAVRPAEIDTVTHTAVVGTPAFMAPEVLRRGAAGAPADVYALGIMLYAAVVGDLPWLEVTAPTFIIGILEGPSEEAFARLAARAPASIVALVRSMLASNPDDRPQAAAVAQRLRSGRAIEAGTSRAPRSPYRLSFPYNNPVTLASAAGLLAMAVLFGLFRHDALSLGPWALRFSKLGSGLALAARIASWAAMAVVGGGVAIASVIVYRRWRRRAEAAVAQALPVLQRIQAIETQLKTAGSPTKSMVIALDQMDVDAFKQQLRESVVVALQDLRGHLGLTASGASADLGRALEVIAGLTQRKKTPVRPSRAKQAALYLGLFGGGAAAITGVTGALAAVDVWHPNRAPEIARVSPAGDRVRRGVPVRLAVDAKDADGDPLTFTFEVAGQTLSGGPTILWRPPADLRDAVVTFKVTVDDGRKKTIGYGTFVLDAPPAIMRLDVPVRVRAGETAVLSAATSDPDGDDVRYAWTVSAGAPVASATSVFTWRAPSRAGRVEVVLVASDGLDTAERRTSLDVVAR